MRRIVSGLPALLVLLAAVAVFLTAGPTLRSISTAKTGAQITLARQVLEGDDILLRIDRAVTAVADSVRPSVVHLEVRSSRRSSSTGAGWVYDDLGHIITNAHVVRNGDQVRVEFSDGRIESGEVLGADPYTDIAVVRVRGVDVFPLARSMSAATGGAVRQGERAFAFGSPFGFKFSMSEGIVSGLGRSPGGGSGSFGGFTNYIQTDAAVNPGNSGGPLVNVHGEVIGMNVAIATSRDTDGTNEGDSAGISFAIPLDTIENVVPQLINSGQVARGFMGANFARGADQTTLAGGSLVTGIRVASVVEDGPAAMAGIRSGDLITHLRGPADPRVRHPAFDRRRDRRGRDAAGRTGPRQRGGRDRCPAGRDARAAAR